MLPTGRKKSRRSREHPTPQSQSHPLDAFGEATWKKTKSTRQSEGGGIWVGQSWALPELLIEIDPGSFNIPPAALHGDVVKVTGLSIGMGIAREYREKLQGRRPKWSNKAVKQWRKSRAVELQIRVCPCSLDSAWATIFAKILCRSTKACWDCLKVFDLSRVTTICDEGRSTTTLESGSVRNSIVRKKKLKPSRTKRATS